jgi:hypothetical protein
MKPLITVLEPLSLWVLFSLLAIAFVGTRPYLALAICVAGGIAMALSSLAGFSSSCQEASEKGGQNKEQTQSKRQ